MLAFCALMTMASVILHARPDVEEEHAEETAEEMFVHPFLAHMGLPDHPGEVSLRLTAYKTRYEQTSETDLAVHIEAGLLRRLGLHVRTDGILHSDYAEVMLQYALLADRELRNGLSIFGQISIATGPVEDHEYKGLVGASFRLSLPGIVVWDGNVHYDPSEEMAEYENAFVFRTGDKYYPILEVRGHISEEIEVYLLPAIKFRIGGHSALGVGVQAAVSDHRDYDLRALITFDVAF
jgi:hypothetical protein